jgi:hypothetical protein
VAHLQHARDLEASPIGFGDDLAATAMARDIKRIPNVATAILSARSNCCVSAQEMHMTKGRPHANSRLAAFIARRVLELRPKKSQMEIAAEAGFVNPNMMSLIKSGRSKLPLDRVPALARALEVDPRLLFLMTLEQAGGETLRLAAEEIFGTVVSRNEVAWLAEIRDASGHTDPALTSRARGAIRAIFGK